MEKAPHSSRQSQGVERKTLSYKNGFRKKGIMHLQKQHQAL